MADEPVADPGPGAPPSNVREAAPEGKPGGDGAHTDGLRLAEESPAGVRTGKLARLMEVSPQSILNWVKAGMPVAGEDTKGRLFDAAACIAWRARTGASAVHGGKRYGSGAPAKKIPGELQGELAKADLAALNRQTAETVLGDLKDGTGVPPREERLSFEGLAGLSAEQLKILAWLPVEVSNFTQSETTRAQLMTRLQKDQMEIALSRGKLHDSAQCEAATASHLMVLRTRLTGLPGRAAASIVAAAKMGPELVPVVKAALVAAVDEVMREIAAEPLGAMGAAA
jgi:hypothetical protein